MEEGLGLILSALVGGSTLVALFSVLGSLFPGVVGTTRRAAEAMPWRSTLIGLVNILFLSILGLVFQALGDGLGVRLIRILALPPALALILGLSFGLAGMAQLIGARLAPERSGPRQALLGAAAMTLASLAPFIGWFGLFPYLAMRGVGGLVIGAFSRRSDAEANTAG